MNKNTAIGLGVLAATAIVGGGIALAVSSKKKTTPASGMAVEFIAVMADAWGVITFSADVTGGTAPYTAAWDFGDGSTSTEGNPTHIYTAAGTYSATLTVTDSTGATATVVHSFTLQSEGAGGGMLVLFAATTTGALDYTFTPTVSGGTGPYTYSWSFGDSAGGASVQEKPTYVYGAAGTYEVLLVVTDSLGNQGSLTQSLTATVGGGGGTPVPTPIVWDSTHPKFMGNMSGIPLDLPGFLTAILDPLRTSPIYLANEGIISTNVSDDPINYPIFTQYGNTNEMQLKSAQDELNALNDPTNPITKWILSGGATPAQFQAYKDQYIAKVAALKHKISLEWNLGYEMPHYIPPPDVFIP